MADLGVGLLGIELRLETWELLEEKPGPDPSLSSLGFLWSRTPSACFR